MTVELRVDASDARNRADDGRQTMVLGAEHGAVERDVPVTCGHADDVRMRRDVSDYGPHAFLEHDIVGPVLADPATGSGDESRHPVAEIPSNTPVGARSKVSQMPGGITYPSPSSSA